MEREKTENGGRKVGDERISVKADPIHEFERCGQTKALCYTPPDCGNTKTEGIDDVHGIDDMCHVVFKFF